MKWFFLKEQFIEELSQKANVNINDDNNLSYTKNMSFVKVGKLIKNKNLVLDRTDTKKIKLYFRQLQTNKYNL